MKPKRSAGPAPKRPDLRRFHKVAKAAAEWATFTPGVCSVSVTAVEARSRVDAGVGAVTEWGVLTAYFTAELSRDVQAAVRVTVVNALDAELARLKRDAPAA